VLNRYFPAARRDLLNRAAEAGTAGAPPEPNPDVLALLLDHAAGGNRPESTWLARIIAARSALPGHLWIAMGLFERPELSGAIHRHLPSLAAANTGNMRWKRFLFKQVCDLGGGVMCKAPNCRACSDYALCFAEGE
jgi:nitrogen fixation protein NifQ